MDYWAYFMRYLGYVLLINLFLTLYLFFVRDKLPDPQDLSPLLKNDPVQVDTSKQPFYVNTENAHFYIKPLYEYHLYGLVVSKYNARKKYLARIDKYLNVTDLCVIWGDNAFSGAYKEVSFWSGEFTCFMQSYSIPFFNTAEDSQKYLKDLQQPVFLNEQLSNNHLLTEDTYLGQQLRDINIGDQIYLSGYLASYGTSPDRTYRGSSTIRTDTGNGACETVYINSFTVLHKNSYRQAFNLSLITLFLIFAVWFAYELNHTRKQSQK